ncbi:MAG: serine/threonine protein kinase [Planctomycetaceae bacterium]|nr:serine/threonine protein kinase [Planctomycetaceae bacterium]
MQQIICECGNKVNLSEAQAGLERRCPRCGRRVFANEADAEAEFKITMEDAPPQPSLPQPSPMGNGQQTAENVATNLQRGSEFDSDATVARFQITQTAPPNGKQVANGKQVDWENAPTQIAHHEDFVVNASPLPDDSGLVTPSAGSGSSLKYDLTKRVMRAIAKPVAPVVPFSGTGQYGIHRILRVHQRGGMGRILLGYDQYLKREVAIKELHADVAEDESIVRRFIGEAEITAQLEHPGVVPIHRIGQGADGLPYYTMKMIKGETLQDAIKAYHRKPGKSELFSLVRRLVSVSKTIAFAHSKGVIHRDLKPANIMIGEHGETLVMDWGLAKPYSQGTEDTYISVIHQTKQARPELTMVGAIVGTPAFMSPEQANAEDNIVGPLSDVFSLGTILYYLLAGQTAFAGRSTQEVLSKVRACSPTPPSQVKSNVVPHGLEAICQKAMAKLPENRYQGATEFADDLCRWLDGEPISAEKDILSAKVRRWLQRNSTPLMGAVWVLILSLLLSSIGVWIVERSRNTSVVPKNEVQRLEGGAQSYDDASDSSSIC